MKKHETLAKNADTDCGSTSPQHFETERFESTKLIERDSAPIHFLKQYPQEVFQAIHNFDTKWSD